MRQRQQDPTPSSDRALWRRCRDTDAPEDAAAHFLDLAAFAEGRLDADESERVAALIAGDPAAAADVEAARPPQGGEALSPALFERIVARAALLAPPAAERRVVPLAFAPRRPPLTAAAQWASLAAAIALAGWLGFAMGTDFSHAYSQAEQSVSEDLYLPELLDPATGFMREFAEDLQT